MLKYGRGIDLSFRTSEEGQMVCLSIVDFFINGSIISVLNQKKNKKNKTKNTK